MEFTMNEHSFSTKLPFGELEVSGNEEYGFRPYQLLVSAVAVCSGGVLRKILNKQRVTFEDIKLKAEVTRNEANVNEITDIHIHFTIVGSQISDEKLEKALALTRKNCPIVQSLQDSIHITETFEQTKM